MNTALIILAAGESSRMGKPKQVLELQGKTLIKRAAEMAISTNCYPICVVLGANKKVVVPELENMPVTLIDNPNYKTGMASSIKMGLIGVYMTQKEVDSVIFITCDMPYVDDKLIEELITQATNDENCQIVASKYEDTVGIPVLFKRSLFADLLDLKEDNGAKSIILNHKNSTKFVDFPAGKYDLDTIEEYLAFQKFSNN